MDSKLLHIKAQHLLSKIDLECLPAGGWRYCGRSDDLNVTLVRHAIEQHFSGDKVYFVSTRHDSRLEDKSDLLDLIARAIDEMNFTLWSEDFCHVMEFKSIGVFRFGGVCA